ncbi:Glycoside hydrolase [Macleaya cordata]|uniref:Glycoside hydrolase n=1 Tax=Macleaya cordata TaxID=56857 RepID=A0A200R2T0_MACCD|nr:Glycoside hydrolase [Macleaya cordata]
MITMKIQYQLFFALISILVLVLMQTPKAVGSVGICYGRTAFGLPSPAQVLSQILIPNKITKVRLYDTDSEVLRLLDGRGIEVMIGIDKRNLQLLAGYDADATQGWLETNVFAHINKEQIKYIVVGNEIFQEYEVLFLNSVIRKLNEALKRLDLADKIKLSSTLSTYDLLVVSSSSTFSPAVLTPMLYEFLRFLRETRAPLMVTVNPVLSSITPKPSTIEDFDRILDFFVAALKGVQFEDISLLVTETGWPTSGGFDAGTGIASTYNKVIIQRSLSGESTLKPGVLSEVFLRSIYDENLKGDEQYDKLLNPLL